MLRFGLKLTCHRKSKTNHIIKKNFTNDRKYLLCALWLTLNKTLWSSVENCCSAFNSSLTSTFTFLIVPLSSQSWETLQRPRVIEDFQSHFRTITTPPRVISVSFYHKQPASKCLVAELKPREGFQWTNIGRLCRIGVYNNWVYKISSQS